MDWKQHIDKEKIVGWRRYLHMHPEVAFQEKETSAYIAKTLESMPGIEVFWPAETSVIGVLKGGKPGKVVGIRAEIDALPMQEEADVEFKSLNPGAMHACGHDIHTACVLGAASVLSSIRDKLCGTVKFIFQAAEEVLPGGAQTIVDSGMVSDCEYFLGLHVLAQLGTGKISCWPGPLTASNDKFHITVTGKSGHWYAPESMLDVVTVGMHIVSSLNSIVSRNISPHDNVVLAVNSFVSDPELSPDGPKAELSGFLATKSNEIRYFIHERMKEIVAGVCDAHGANYEFDITVGFDPIINDGYLTALVQETVKEFYGEDMLVKPRVLMASDDYSAFHQIAPQVFFLVGSGSPEEGYEYFVHNTKYKANEDILPIGSEMFVALTLKLLG